MTEIVGTCKLCKKDIYDWQVMVTTVFDEEYHYECYLAKKRQEVDY